MTGSTLRVTQAIPAPPGLSNQRTRTVVPQGATRCSGVRHRATVLAPGWRFRGGGWRSRRCGWRSQRIRRRFRQPEQRSPAAEPGHVVHQPRNACSRPASHDPHATSPGHWDPFDAALPEALRAVPVGSIGVVDSIGFVRRGRSAVAAGALLTGAGRADTTGPDRSVPHAGDPGPTGGLRPGTRGA